MMLENIVKYCIPSIEDSQRERAVKIFLREKTSFAVIDGALFMSESSLDLFREKSDHIIKGHLDI